MIQRRKLLFQGVKAQSVAHITANPANELSTMIGTCDSIILRK